MSIALNKRHEAFSCHKTRFPSSLAFGNGDLVLNFAKRTVDSSLGSAQSTYQTTVGISQPWKLLLDAPDSPIDDLEVLSVSGIL